MRRCLARRRFYKQFIQCYFYILAFNCSMVHIYDNIDIYFGPLSLKATTLVRQYSSQMNKHWQGDKLLIRHSLLPSENLMQLLYCASCVLSSNLMWEIENPSLLPIREIENPTSLAIRKNEISLSFPSEKLKIFLFPILMDILLMQRCFCQGGTAPSMPWKRCTQCRNWHSQKRCPVSPMMPWWWWWWYS